MAVTRTIVVSMYNSNPNRLEVIDKLLIPSILRNSSSDTQLVLADDCSPMREETDQLIDKHKPDLINILGDLKVIRREDNLGFTGSYNDATERADGNVLLITNEDVYFPRGSIDCLIKEACELKGQAGPVTQSAWGFQNTRYFNDKIGGKYLTSFEPEELDKLEEVQQMLTDVMNNTVYGVSSVSGFCFAIPKDRFEEVGRFDHKMVTFWSDTDLSQKMNKITGVYVASSAFVYHHNCESLTNQPMGGELGPLKPLIVDGRQYAEKWGRMDTLKDFCYRGMQGMFDLGTVTRDIKKRVNHL
jgi:GT2 family glycosyltransferase